MKLIERGKRTELQGLPYHGEVIIHTYSGVKYVIEDGDEPTLSVIAYHNVSIPVYDAEDEHIATINTDGRDYGVGDRATLAHSEG